MVKRIFPLRTSYGVTNGEALPGRTKVRPVKIAVARKKFFTPSHPQGESRGIARRVGVNGLPSAAIDARSGGYVLRLRRFDRRLAIARFAHAGALRRQNEVARSFAQPRRRRVACGLVCDALQRREGMPGEVIYGKRDRADGYQEC